MTGNELIRMEGPDEYGNYKTFCDFKLNGVYCGLGFLTSRLAIAEGNGIDSPEYNSCKSALVKSIIQFLALPPDDQKTHTASRLH